ncbi:hypothetical protein N7457_008888 [Penicillium paradoxum]|uniref:uncharacterized protein n=1 Tax=Penicillium paradoxum TaxID=176176 RepID=UPI002548CA4D|nr:uncharacterized protein N7457_008888 [Penicillium paradoxum]KAJ5773992.1 hypothetical protein N7457_008888 [Penicillium paradoxum]
MPAAHWLAGEAGVGSQTVRREPSLDADQCRTLWRLSMFVSNSACFTVGQSELLIRDSAALPQVGLDLSHALCASSENFRESSL